MPLYDYRCTSCAHEFEILQGINDPPPGACPKCQHAEVKKKVVAPAFTFKGSGWYKDLYGSSNKSEAKKPTDSESKPAAEPAKKEKSAKKETADS